MNSLQYVGTNLSLDKCQHGKFAWHALILKPWIKLHKAKKKKISGYFNIKYGFICMVCVTRTKAVKLHLKNKTIILILNQKIILFYFNICDFNIFKYICAYN